MSVPGEGLQQLTLASFRATEASTETKHRSHGRKRRD